MTQLTKCPRCSRYAIREGTEGWCLMHGSFELRPLVPLPIPADDPYAGKREPCVKGLKI